ncbi:MAG: DUF1028 domain-containing protein [Planctomycetota bacterium]|jgi:uncharacterized Ntn-hydrolase superfamily protein
MGRTTTAATVLLLAACASAPRSPRPVATFSIVGYDPQTRDLGVAVQSKFFGVGSVVPWAKAGVGAVATQAWANVKYGPEGLKLLESGRSARQAVDALTKSDAGREQRQLGIVDAQGRAASYTGRQCLAWAGHEVGEHFCVQGNILAGEQVVAAMAKAFEQERRKWGTELADWLMAALQAGQQAGGDRRGQQSAALLVVREKGGYMGGNDRFIDLRVEDHPRPIEELARLLELHKRYRKFLQPRKR